MILSFFVSLALSIDALFVGLSYGLRDIHFPICSRVLIFLQTAVLLFLFLKIGNFLSIIFPSDIIEPLSTGILLYLGIVLCLKSRTKKQSHTKFGKFAYFFFQPSACDKNQSATLEPKEAILLGLILSTDAFGVGIGIGASTFSHVYLPIFAASMQMVFLSIGSTLGKRYLQQKFSQTQGTLLSGILFVLLAVVRFLKIA